MKSETPSQDELTHSVNPTRLRLGNWCHQKQKTLDEGDIVASYSADRIGNGQPIRKPFCWKSDLWVCVSCSNQSGAEAYRLIPVEAFEGDFVTYRQKCSCAEEARRDPNGFYHGIVVQHHGEGFVLCGPPARFVPSESEQPEPTAQLELFGGAL